MAAAIRDPDPVIFCEHKALFAIKGEVPGRRARRCRSGRRAHRPRGRGLHDRRAGGDGARGPSRPPSAWPRSTAIDAEVIDLRTLVPLDVATILASVEKTSRLFTVEENPRLCGWGAEIVSIVADEGFYSLDAPIVRITTPHIPLPSASALEDLAIPSVDRIVDTVQRRLEDARDGRDRDADRRPSLGTGRMGSAMAERWRPTALAVVVCNRTPERAEALRPSGRARASPRRRREVAAARRRHDLDGRRRRRGARHVYGGAGRACSPARAPGRCWSTAARCRPTPSGRSTPAVRARGVGILDAPGVGQRRPRPRSRRS